MRFTLLDQALQSEAHLQLFIFDLFWGQGLAADVKSFCQNNPQTNNTRRRQSVAYKSTSMKTSLIACGLQTANPLHLIRQIPKFLRGHQCLCPTKSLFCSAQPHHCFRGEALGSVPMLNKQSMLGCIGCQSQALRQEGDFVPISREAAQRFDRFVCSTLSGPGFRASCSQSLNGQLVAVTSVSPSKLPTAKTAGKLPRREH